MQVIQGTSNVFLLAGKQPNHSKGTWVSISWQMFIKPIQGLVYKSNSWSETSIMQSFPPGGFSPYTHHSYLFYQFPDFPLTLRPSFMPQSNRGTEHSDQCSGKILQCPRQPGFTTGETGNQIIISKDTISFWLGDHCSCRQWRPSLMFYCRFPLRQAQITTYWTNTTSEPSSLGNAHSQL